MTKGRRFWIGWASAIVGFPFRLYQGMMLARRQRAVEAYQLRVMPCWWVHWAWRYFRDPVAIDPRQDVNCSGLRWCLYIGHFVGFCRLGHQHTGGANLVAWRAVWWNLRHGRNPLNHVGEATEMLVERLMAEMKNCGFRHREIPKILQDQEVVGFHGVREWVAGE